MTTHPAERVPQPETVLTADKAYARTLPFAMELSILNSSPDTGLRMRFYGVMGVEQTSLQTVGDTLLRQVTPKADMLLIKPELNQSTGSFKKRGAAAAVMIAQAEAQHAELTLDTVVTASAGNHALGVAETAKACGSTNVITHTFEGISSTKEQALIAAGVTIVKHPSFEDAEIAAQQPLGEKTSAYIPAFDSFSTMAGQSTIASEVFQDLLAKSNRGEINLHQDEIHFVLPGGGGGCASGNAVMVRALKDIGALGDNVKVWVAQGEGADAIAKTIKGKKLYVASPWFEGARVTKPGVKNMAILSDERFVQGMIEVSEADTGDAMRVLHDHHGHDVESTGALSMGAAMVLDRQLPPTEDGKRRIFVTVTSGKNVTQQTVDHFRQRSEARHERYNGARNAGRIATAQNTPGYKEISEAYLKYQSNVDVFEEIRARTADQLAAGVVALRGCKVVSSPANTISR